MTRALAVGEPNSLLRRRPDVRAAERQLAAATAREGVVAADLYPRITLTGFLGLLAGRGNLFDVRRLARVGGDAGVELGGIRSSAACAPVCAAPKRPRASRSPSSSRPCCARSRKPRTRWSPIARSSSGWCSSTEQARESARAADIARVRYREGAVDFLALLDAERTQLQAEDGVAQAESAVFTSVIAVYKALGGIPANPPPNPPAATVKQ